MLNLFAVDRQGKRFVLTRAERLMQVPDEIRKCVAFACCKRGGEMRLAGTVFFLGRRFPKSDSGWGVTVTARHVIRGIRDKSDDGKVYLRLNTRGGSPAFIESSVNEWFEHPREKNVDVAVSPWAPGFGRFDHLVY